MIKTQELRRGNWIMYKGQPIQVTTIGEYGIQSKTADSTINAKFQFDISPIPLTPELLGKIKGVKVESENKFLYDTTDWRICLLKEELPKWELHWLQNYIYFRTGKELEITL